VNQTLLSVTARADTNDKFIKSALPAKLRTRISIGEESHVNSAAGLAIFNVVIFYDDIPAGQHAVRTIRTVVGALLGQEAAFRPKMLRFDLVETPDRFVSALACAVRTNLLLVSVSSVANTLPPIAVNWVEKWTQSKRGNKAAVVALVGDTGRPHMPKPQQLQFLQTAAAAAGLEFFTSLPDHRESFSPTLRSFLTQAEKISPVPNNRPACSGGH